MSKSKVDPCGVCSFIIWANLVLCVQCSKWILSRCAGVKSVSAKFSRNFASKGILERQWSGKTLWDKA